MARIIQHRRGTEATIPQLADGEIGIATDTRHVFFGAGGVNNQVALQEDLLQRATMTTADIDYYVDPINGNDENDGLSPSSGENGAGPFKTIQHVLNILPDIINHKINVNLISGIYNEVLFLTGHSGSQRIAIIGEDMSTSILNGGLYGYNLGINLYLQSLTAKRTSDSATLQGFDTGAVKIASGRFFDSISVTFDGGGLGTAGCDIINTNGILRDPTFKNCQRCVVADLGSHFHIDCTNSVASTGNNTALTAWRGAVISKGYGTMPAATTEEEVNRGGQIR